MFSDDFDEECQCHLCERMHVILHTYMLMDTQVSYMQMFNASDQYLLKALVQFHGTHEHAYCAVCAHNS